MTKGKRSIIFCYVQKPLLISLALQQGFPEENYVFAKDYIITEWFLILLLIDS